jgi:hypothetical protein
VDRGEEAIEINSRRVLLATRGNRISGDNRSMDLPVHSEDRRYDGVRLSPYTPAKGLQGMPKCERIEIPVYDTPFGGSRGWT